MKRTSRLMQAVLLAIMVVVVTGCQTRITDFTLLSTKNVDLSNMETYVRSTERVIGKDTQHIIIIIPTVRPSLKEAIDRAIENVRGGVCLVDGVVYIESWYIPLIYGETSYIAEGTVLIDPALAK